MKRAFTLLIIIALWGCSSQKSTSEYKAISSKVFLNKPFGFDETIESFKKETNLRFDTKKVAQENKHYPEQTDTIYTLLYKKSEITFYKSHTGKEFLLTGKILNKQLILKNDIRIGMSKKEFLNRFSDHLNFKDNRIQITGEGTNYTFVFRKEKITEIDVDNYFD